MRCYNETNIAGHAVKRLSCSILASPSLDYMDTLHEDAVPGRWYPAYILKNPVRPVSFHPKQACHNILNLCCFVSRHGWSREVRDLLAVILEEIEAHIERYNDEIFALYPFEYRELGKTLPEGWSCALGQSFLLGAWIKLYRTTGEQKYLDKAHRTYASIARIREYPGQAEPWVTFVDDRGFLWFEEYPSVDDPQTRILNGHIYAIMGLYSYYLLVSEPGTEHLIQAGMATVLEYFDDFRVPGQVNRYSLLRDSKADYMPSRSIMQQKWLFDVSGDQAFERQYLAFKSDMGWSLARPGEEYYHA